MKNTYRISLPRQDVQTAEGAAKKVLENYLQKYGMIANVSGNMANHSGLIHTYATGYEAFYAEGDLAPAECELVFLTISRENQCEYCVAGHTIGGAYVSMIPQEVMDAVRNYSPVPDPKLNALVNFTCIMMEKKGNPSTDEVKAFLAAGYTEKTILSIILAIAVKTISNYTNHIFHTENDAMYAPFEWKAKK